LEVNYDKKFNATGNENEERVRLCEKWEGKKIQGIIAIADIHEIRKEAQNEVFSADGKGNIQKENEKYLDVKVV
jgi:hypothetical protein